MKYKRIIVLITLVFVILSLLLSFVYADVWVNGYYRKDGTYVKGHWRSDPDGDPYNNWSFPGNTNPHTGKVAPGNPETYLKNYYNSSTTKYNYTDINKTTEIYKILDNKGNITGLSNLPSLPIQENEDNIIIFPEYTEKGLNIDASSRYIFKTIAIKKIGFSSVDNVASAIAINSVGKAPNASPITIGSSIEDVIKAMGTPESTLRDSKSFKYRNSTVHFDDDWKVQSWDNRYGNLKVSLEGERSIDVLDIDDIIKIATDKSVEETIKEFQKYLENH